MKTIIINIGNELLNGARRNSNADYLIEELTPEGAEVIGVTLVRDDEREIAEAIKDGGRRAQLVILTGGLGPTADDLTRQVLAKTCGKRLVINDIAERTIRERFRQRGIAMPASNLSQAMVPEGGAIIENTRGTAPGLIIEKDDTFFVALPGPPAELAPMTQAALKALLREKGHRGAARRWHTLHTCGMPESLLCEKIEDLFRVEGNPVLSVTAHAQGVDLRITAQGKDADEAEELIEALAKQIRERLGDYVYGQDGQGLEQMVGEALVSRGMTIGVAESCTGGLLGSRLSSVAGSSAYFLGGVIAYHDDVKKETLDISAETLEKHGAVSAEVAEHMAVGVLEKLDCGVGVAITGIAGPGGGTNEKPVGTVFICVAKRGGKKGCARFHFGGERESVRLRSSQMALDMVRRMLMDKDAGRGRRDAGNGKLRSEEGKG